MVQVPFKAVAPDPVLPPMPLPAAEQVVPVVGLTFQLNVTVPPKAVETPISGDTLMTGAVRAVVGSTTLKYESLASR